MQYFIAFLEGIITFISPCLLPMLPVYVSYFAGGETHATKKTLKNALGFVVGFTVIFVIMGALAGTVGGFFRNHQTAVNLVTGLIVAFFAFHCFGEWAMVQRNMISVSFPLAYSAWCSRSVGHLAWGHSWALH